MKREELLNIKEAAEYIGVHAITVARYCKQGKLTYYLFGQRKRFKKEDLDKFLRVVPCKEEHDPFIPR